VSSGVRKTKKGVVWHTIHSKQATQIYQKD